jgi:RNase P/RNase MRP subunit POP5
MLQEYTNIEICNCEFIVNLYYTIIRYTIILLYHYTIVYYYKRRKRAIVRVVRMYLTNVTKTLANDTSRMIRAM